MLSKLFYLLVAGGIGGLLGWVVQEPFFPRQITTMDEFEAIRRQFVYGAIMGLFIGGMIGLAGGWAKGTVYQAVRGLLLSGGVGLLGGGLGLQFGSIVFRLLGGDISGGSGMGGFVYQMFARAMAFAVFGAVIGAGEGLTARSFRRGIQGAVGGAIGGFAGGFMFNIIGDLTTTAQFTADPSRFRGPGGQAEVGMFSRAVAFPLMGAAIGLFIGLIEIVGKQAWVRVIYGRNEGKEYLIDAAVSTIGRAENADVPLRGDMNVMPHHARIVKHGQRYIIEDLGSPIGIAVNRQPVRSAELVDGAEIQIGSFHMQFREKAGNAKRAVDAQKGTALAPPPNVPAGVCAFCGQRKDANGNCACSVGAAPPPPAPQPGASAFGAQSVGSPTLVGLDGAVMGQRFPLTPAGITMGRDPGNQVPLVNDTAASRRHARVTLENGVAVVYDEGSTNGTFVNNARINRQPLNPGDVLRVGSTHFRLE